VPTIRIARVIAGVAALAVALVGIAPTTHVHADDDHQIVHQHAIADGASHHDDSTDDHDGGVEQPDHTAARILTLSFDVAAQVAAFGPPARVVAPAAPVAERAAPRIPTTLLPTHDPPLRFVSSPAPPPAV
jgi:hypothetical protein